MGMEPKAPIKPNVEYSCGVYGGPIVYEVMERTIKMIPSSKIAPWNLGIPTRKVILKALILRGYVDYVGFREAKSPREMYKQFIIHLIFFAGPSNLWSFAAFPYHFEEPLHIPTSSTSNIRYIRLSWKKSPTQIFRPISLKSEVPFVFFLFATFWWRIRVWGR